MPKANPTQHRVLPRDLESLAAIGRFRMLKRAQLHRWMFAGLSETVVRRFIDRLEERGWLGAERLNRNGTQVVWCTVAGRDALVQEGIAKAEDLFPARGPVAIKDMAHTGAIVDAAIRLSELGRGGDWMVPAWDFQRRLGGRMRVIPDLLCLTRATEVRRGTALAVEVDLGGEPIASVLVPKTATLVSFLQPYAGSAVGILLLTVGDRRRQAIEQALRTAGLSLPIVVADLSQFTTGSVWTRRSDEKTPS
jgi:hypothetical protein